jgi:2-polyprenyl-3-methyl-5-hydroxy-6-metoxy-1,4-benzoquinol methylase
MQMPVSSSAPAVRVPCPVCGVSAAPAERVGAATYYGCPVCETLFQHPMPTIEAMRAYVDAEYAGGVYNDYVAAANLKSLTFAGRVRAIEKRIGRGRLLDVGASCGFFVEQALRSGFDAYGIELSSEAIAMAPEGVRERLILGDVNTLDLARLEPFDVITAFDLIEHVFDPLKFLRELARVAKPGSWVVISTPDVSHLLRHVLRARWPMFQPLQHTVLFSPRSLRLALSSAGYDQISIGPATKTLTADYLAGQINMYLPAAVNLYRRASRAIPEALRTRPINVNIGELLAFARLPERA